MRQKTFRAKRKQQKRRKRAKQLIKQHEKGKLKFGELPRLARTLLTRKRRKAARAGS